MKEAKYIIGFGVVLGIIDVTLLAILKIANTIDEIRFRETLAQSLSILGIVVVSAVVISLIIEIFKSK
jgi:hypothetical protein